MSPFQNSHQPTHAGQPAGAFSFAPEEEPALLPFDGEALPSDFASMDAPGFWNHEIASQNAFDSGLNEPWMMPTCNAEGGFFDYTWNYQTDEPFGFGTGFASQSIAGPGLNGQMMLPPFDPTLLMDQPLGLREAEVASQGALAVGQASIASDGAQSHLQDASFDFHPTDWTNHGAGMSDALDPFVDSVRFAEAVQVPKHWLALPSRQFASNWTGPSTDRNLENVINNNGMATPPHVDYSDAAGFSKQQVHAPAVPGAYSTTCSLPLSDGPLSTTRRQERKKSQQLTCVFDGCTHKGTFSGSYELERHVKAKHQAGAGTFACCAEGCLNKQLHLPWTFTRSDKLTAHIKATHTRDTVFAACPVTGCAFGRCTLETLGVHIARVHDKRARRYAKEVEEGRAFLNASSCKARKCPLWRCGKHVKAPELLGHITKHAKDDVLAAIPELEHEGLIVHHASDLGLIITVSCPICNTKSDDVDHFINHLWTSHLFLAGSGGADHFKAWRSVLIHHASKPVDGDTKNLQPWANLQYWRPSRSEARISACPSCLLPFGDMGAGSYNPTRIQQAARNAALAHHLSLLRPEAEVVAELYPYRMQILRLYPEFVSHPVFADFDQTKDGVASSSQEPSQFGGTGFMEGVESHGQAMIDFDTSC